MEAGTLDNTIKVAVVRSDRRRGAVAEAFALIADDVRRRVKADSSPVIVPNLDYPARPWTCTHRDTLSAAADAILGGGILAHDRGGNRPTWTPHWRPVRPAGIPRRTLEPTGHVPGS